MERDAHTCTHTQILLVVENLHRVRCRHCHLTLTEDELDDGCCPECWQERRHRHCEFDSLDSGRPPLVRYRCEACGVMLQPYNA